VILKRESRSASYRDRQEKDRSVMSSLRRNRAITRIVLSAAVVLVSALLACWPGRRNHLSQRQQSHWLEQPCETVLTPTNVASTSFGLLHSVVLDDQVDGQPLLVPGVNITAGSNQGKHDVVYVATEEIPSMP